MDIPDIIIFLECLFCGTPLEKRKGAEYKSGDLIKCNKCAESNDYDSVLNVAKEEVLTSVKDDLKEKAQSVFKNMFTKK